MCTCQISPLVQRTHTDQCHIDWTVAYQTSVYAYEVGKTNKSVSGKGLMEVAKILLSENILDLPL